MLYVQDCHYMPQQNGETKQPEHMKLLGSIYLYHNSPLVWHRGAWVVCKQSGASREGTEYERRVPMTYPLFSDFFHETAFLSSYPVMWVSNLPKFVSRILKFSSVLICHAFWTPIQRQAAPKNGSRFSRIPRTQIYSFWLWSSGNYLLFLLFLMLCFLF